MKIKDRIIDSQHFPLVIAEIGINHNGSYKKAKKMVYDAYKSGAECVKFQLHIVEDEMIKDAQNVIPGNAEESIWDIMNNASLSVEEHKKLKSYVEELGMIYLCTPFSRTAADILEEMNVDAYKIGSGECNNYPLVKHIASFGKPIILSTGMNDINSITKSVEIIKQNEIDFALLHCTSMYPTPYDKVRLGSISHLSKEFPEATLGLSDHSLGNYTAFAAVALGASILEKHFTSNKLWEGPDVEISIDPNELKDLIKGTKAIHKALGGKKEILIEEKPTIDFAYASVVSIKDIKKGEKFNKDNIWVKRPGTGDIKAEYYSNILGKTAKKNISKDTQLRWDMISNE
jgi:N-acetylneuraminate synthase